jgi:hypothetical protein
VLPNLFLRPIEPSVERMLNHFHQGASTRVQATAKPVRSPRFAASFGEARRSAAGAKAAGLGPKPLLAEPTP